MINFENLDKFAFHGVGRFDIPQIEPVTDIRKASLYP